MSDNPFAARCGGAYQSTDDRLDCVKTMTKSQLLAASEMPGLQKMVAAAIRARLRKLEKANG